MKPPRNFTMRLSRCQSTSTNARHASALSRDLNKFRMFGEYALVPRLQDKHKHEDRALLVCYIHTVYSAHYRVFVPHTGQSFLCSRTNYRPYNPQFDPARLY